MKRKVLILGSTGSIGTSALAVIRENRDLFDLVGLACGENIELLNAQIDEFRPSFVSIDRRDDRDRVVFDKKRTFFGGTGIDELVAMDVDVVVNALPGSSGLGPTIRALRLGKTLALANKESLVMAGRIISAFMKKDPTCLIPVDSEHSALFQLLKGLKDDGDVKSLIITASGGPFRQFSARDLAEVKVEEALNHPTWKMGKKVTLDSATLMNKGLEVIEARWLFDMEPHRIKVLVHPESVVHGIVEMEDGSFFSYLSYPDMKIPIAYALHDRKRYSLPVPPLELEKVGSLTFSSPDLERFPLLKVAYDALEAGDSAMITLNAANEVASNAFLNGRIGFTMIPVIVEKTLARHESVPVIDDLEMVLDTHVQAQGQAEKILGELSYA